MNRPRSVGPIALGDQRLATDWSLRVQQDESLFSHQFEIGI